jgi:hypothetical protein
MHHSAIQNQEYFFAFALDDAMFLLVKMAYSGSAPHEEVLCDTGTFIQQGQYEAALRS